MTIAATTVWEVRSTATASNVNGGGFNAARGGTDYSLQDAAQLALTDLAMVAAGTTITSATGGFADAMKGNLLHIASGTNFTAGWYEIVSVADTNTATLDRDATTGGNGSSGVGKVGGGLATPLDTSLPLAAGHIVWVKGGETYTAGGALSFITKSGTATASIILIGYTGSRAIARGTDRPTIALGANTFTTGNLWGIRNIIWTGTTDMVLCYNRCVVVNCSFACTSTSANKSGLTFGDYGAVVDDCEFSSPLGYGVYPSSHTSVVTRCYVHDCLIGIVGGAVRPFVFDSIIESNVTGMSYSVGGYAVACRNNTFRNNGTAITGGSAGSAVFSNNIFADSNIGASWSAVVNNEVWDYNDWYGNGTDVTNVTKGPHDTAVDPSFVSACVKGTDGATNSSPGTTFTSAGSNFSGATTADFLVVKAGAGATTGVYAIAAVAPGGDNTKLTLATSPGNSLSGVTFGVVCGSDNRLQSASGCRDIGFGIALGTGGTNTDVDQGAHQFNVAAAAVWPAQANVSTTETAWGPTGAEYAGALNLGNYTLNTVVASDYTANTVVASDYTANTVVASDYTANMIVASDFTANTVVASDYNLKSLSTLNTIVASDYTANTVVTSDYNLKSLSTLNTVVASDYTANTLAALLSSISGVTIVTGTTINAVSGVGHVDGEYPLTPIVMQGGNQIIMVPSTITLPTTAQVEAGVVFYDVGGAGEQTGLYPTSATTEATQLAADQAVVAAGTESILFGETILGQAGALPLADVLVASGGTYVSPATTIVKDGEFYGPASSLEGSYAGGGSGGGAIFGSSIIRGQ